jgi:L-lysine 2,3-aminomutase
VEVQEDVRMENVESAVKTMQKQQGVLMKQQEVLLKLVGDQSAMLEQLLGAKSA